MQFKHVNWNLERCQNVILHAENVISEKKLKKVAGQSNKEPTSKDIILKILGAVQRSQHEASSWFFQWHESTSGLQWGSGEQDTPGAAAGCGGDSGHCVPGPASCTQHWTLSTAHCNRAHRARSQSTTAMKYM